MQALLDGIEWYKQQVNSIGGLRFWEESAYVIGDDCQSEYGYLPVPVHVYLIDFSGLPSLYRFRRILETFKLSAWDS